MFGNHVLARNTLPPRERELVILRIGWLCRSGYEWGQHVRIARDSGLRDDEIARIARGPDAPGWSELDRALLRATDELHDDAFISDATWQALSQHLDTQQLIDLVFTVGQYQLVSMALNSFGVQPEPGLRAPARAVSGRLAGKIALVIGAGQTPGDTIGNGRATAVLFAREGARVVAVDRRLAAAEETVAQIREEGGDGQRRAGRRHARGRVRGADRRVRAAPRPHRRAAQQRRHRRRRRRPGPRQRGGLGPHPRAST